MRRENEMFHFVVVPLDGSEFAAHALPVGIDLARAVGASVRVLGVAPTDAELAWTYDHVAADASRAGVDEADVRVIVDPDPTKTLVSVSRDARNVLCLASHLRRKPAAAVMRSVGHELSNEPRIPL
jgi:nucleotide-binding universal stress UspA family protein